MQLEKDTALRRATAGDAPGRKIKRRRLDLLFNDTSTAKRPIEAKSEDRQPDDQEVGDLEVGSVGQNLLQDDKSMTSSSAQSVPKSSSKASLGHNSGLRTEQVEDLPPTAFFYLLKTGTTSSSKVVIPLDLGTSLTHCLQDRTVLEYPTIFVLPNAPDSLPDGFILEEDYNMIRKGEEAELKEALRSLGPSRQQQTMQPEPRDTLPSHTDAQRILDMLKRDVTR
jgi:hypothetical protein